MARVLVLEKSPWPNEGFIQSAFSEEPLVTSPLEFFCGIPGVDT